MSTLRYSLPLAAALLAAPQCSAFLTNSSWQLAADSTAQFGFDSNIAEAHEATSDGLLIGIQNLLLRRRGSATHFSLGGQISNARFLSNADQNSVDGGVVMTYAYPADDSFAALMASGARTAATYIAPPQNTEVSRTSVRVAWNTQTDANSDLGLRLRTNHLSLLAQNEWFVAPKLLWSNGVRFSRIEYTDNNYVNSDSLTVRSSVLHDWRPDARWGTEYKAQFERGESTARFTGSHMQVHSLSLVADGILWPKIYGRLSAGASLAHYSGATTGDDLNPNLGFGLTWEKSPLTEFHLDGGYEYSFGATGDARRETSITLSAIQQLARGLNLTVSLAPAHLDRRYAFSEITDNEFRISTSLTYQITQTFNASMTARWADVSSSQSTRTFTRTELFASATFHY